MQKEALSPIAPFFSGKVLDIGLVFVLMLAFILGGAHFWRAGHFALGVVCVLLSGIAWCRWAWIRLSFLILLPLLAGSWIFAAGRFVQLRMLLDQPWARLVCILLAVALFTVGAACFLLTERGRQRFSRGAESAFVQSAVFLSVGFLLGVVEVRMPGMFLLSRLAPDWGFLQVFILALWGAWLSGKLLQPTVATRMRLRAWQLFSIFFFAQFATSLIRYVHDLSGSPLHLPVPGLILGAPLFRGGGLFMLILFTVSVLCAGAAWCSHLCYFGVWDATLAQQKKASADTGLAARLRKIRLVMLGLIVVVPLGLRLAGASPSVALAFGLCLGLAFFPVGWLVSRRYGIAAYCIGLCPLGLFGNWLGRLSPWRIFRTEFCTGCLACTRVCRYAALLPEDITSGHPNKNCTLCRDCLNTCRHHGLTMGLWKTRWQGKNVERFFVALVTVLHCLFLGAAQG